MTSGNVPRLIVEDAMCTLAVRSEGFAVVRHHSDQAAVVEAIRTQRRKKVPRAEWAYH